MNQMTDYLQYGLMASHVYADYRQPLSIDVRPMQAGEQVGVSAYNVNAGLGPDWSIAKISDFAPFNVKFGGTNTTYEGGAIDSVYWQNKVWADALQNPNLTPQQLAVAAPIANPADLDSAQMNGFYARVYIKEVGGVKKAVIAIEGSESLDYAIPAKNALKDIPGANIKDSTLDWLGNDLPAIAGDQVLPQMFPAYHFSQWAIENLHAAGITDITFTGHSLGGGLAAAMGALFDLPSYVYNALPIRQSLVAFFDGTASLYAEDYGWKPVGTGVWNIDPGQHHFDPTSLVGVLPGENLVNYFYNIDDMPRFGMRLNDGNWDPELYAAATQLRDYFDAHPLLSVAALNGTLAGLLFLLANLPLHTMKILLANIGETMNNLANIDANASNVAITEKDNDLENPEFDRLLLALKNTLEYHHHTSNVQGTPGALANGIGQEDVIGNAIDVGPTAGKTGLVDQSLWAREFHSLDMMNFFFTMNAYGLNGANASDPGGAIKYLIQNLPQFYEVTLGSGYLYSGWTAEKAPDAPNDDIAYSRYDDNFYNYMVRYQATLMPGFMRDLQAVIDHGDASGLGITQIQQNFMTINANSISTFALEYLVQIYANLTKFAYLAELTAGESGGTNVASLIQADVSKYTNIRAVVDYPNNGVEFNLSFLNDLKNMRLYFDELKVVRKDDPDGEAIYNAADISDDETDDYEIVKADEEYGMSNGLLNVSRFSQNGHGVEGRAWIDMSKLTDSIFASYSIDGKFYGESSVSGWMVFPKFPPISSDPAYSVRGIDGASMQHMLYESSFDALTSLDRIFIGDDTVANLDISSLETDDGKISRWVFVGDGSVNVTGSGGADAIFATPLISVGENEAASNIAHHIDGRAGNDTIYAGNGNDVLVGGPGADWLHGGGSGTVQALPSDGVDTADYTDASAPEGIGVRLDDWKNASFFNFWSENKTWVDPTRDIEVTDGWNNVDHLRSIEVIKGSEEKENKVYIDNLQKSILYSDNGISVDSGSVFIATNNSYVYDGRHSQPDNDHLELIGNFSVVLGVGAKAFTHYQIELEQSILNNPKLHGISGNQRTQLQINNSDNDQIAMTLTKNSTGDGWVDTGTNGLAVNGIAETDLYGSSGNDSITVSMDFFSASADNNLLRFIGGGGVDALTILPITTAFKVMNLIFDAGAGNESVAVRGLENLDYRGGEGEDSVSYADMQKLNAATIGDKHGITSGIVVSSTLANQFMVSKSYSVVTVSENVETSAVYLTIDKLSGIEQITATDLNDYLAGSRGHETLIGGKGDDTYVLAANDSGVADDVVVEDADGGNDWVMIGQAGRTSLGDAIENGQLLDAGGATDLTGNDTINQLIGNAGANNLDGRGGADTLTGLAGADTLLGGDGNDQLLGGLDNDSLYGGADADILMGEDGDDTLTGAADTVGDYFNGGVGQDSIIGDGGNDNLSGGEGNDYVQAGGVGAAHIEGGEGDDTLVAGEDTVGDTLDGGEGLDSIIGSDNDDWLIGGGGSDTIVSAEGNDTIFAGAGNEALTDTVGNNYLDGGEGSDTIQSGDGNDTLWGGDRADIIISGNGDNWIFGGGGIDSIIAGTGNDMIFGGAGGESLYGGDGNDTINGDSGNDLLRGGNGADLLNGGMGNDILIGTDDQLYGGSGSDTLISEGGYAFAGDGDDGISLKGHGSADGGDGTDSVVIDLTSSHYVVSINGSVVAHDTVEGQAYEYYSATNVESWSFGVASEPFFIPSLDPAETVEGTSVADNLTGTDEAEAFVDSTGNDTVFAAGGNDILTGGDGKNQLSGGDGDDTLSGNGEDDYLAGDDGSDSILGGNANDVVDAGDGNDTAEGGAGMDTILGSFGDDSILGDDGDDVLNAGSGADVILGGDGNDALDGGTGRDTLRGGDGADTILAGNDDDVIYGDAGYDLIHAQGGADTISGNDGNDSITGGVNISGGNGNDSLIGGILAATLHGDAGNDHIEAGRGDDLVYGDSGDDFLLGGDGSDTVIAGDGNDTLAGGSGTNILMGGAGSDWYIISPSLEFTTILDATLSNESGNHLVIDISAGTTRLVKTEGNIEVWQNNVEIALANVAAIQTINLLGSSIAGISDSAISEVDTIGIGNAAVGETIIGSLNAGYFVDSSNQTARIFGFAGDDTLFGGAGDDTISDASGNNIVQAGDGDDVVVTGDGEDSIDGGDGNNLLLGGGGFDTLTGGDGNDTLNGGGDFDTMIGGDGNDYYYIDSDDDFVDEQQGKGTDTAIVSNLYYAFTNNYIENVFVKFNLHQQHTIVMNDLNNYVSSDLSDTLYSPLGGSTIVGLGGDDTLYGGNAGDLLVAGGIISTQSSDGNNILFGLGGDDTLIGGAGIDILAGGNLNDLYEIHNSSAEIIEGDAPFDSLHGADYSGSDSVVAYVDYAISDNIEVLSLMGVATHGIGNNQDNTIIGGDNSETLQGQGGNDILSGGGGNDLVAGEAGNDTIYVSSGMDTIDGGDDSDYVIIDGLDSGSGGFELRDSGTSGIDIVRSSINISLGDGYEWLFLFGGATSGTGNSGDNLIYGTEFSNILDGGAGADTMKGLTGYDYFVVDNLGDQVSTSDLPGDPGYGDDTVSTSVDYELNPGFSTLILAGMTVSWGFLGTI